MRKEGYATDETTIKQEVEHPVKVDHPATRPAQTDADNSGGSVLAHERPPVPKATYQRMGSRK